MHGVTIKIVNAQQAKLNNYKNTKLKLLKTNAAICFNKMCKINKPCFNPDSLIICVQNSIITILSNVIILF